MKNNFDTIIDRRDSGSLKWDSYEREVLPLWVADMDFAAPPAVLEELQRRVEYGVFGYSVDLPELKAVVAERLERLYAWPVALDSVHLLPGLVCGLNLACRAIGDPGDAVLVNTPVYPPFLMAPGNQGRRLQTFPQTSGMVDGRLCYSIDFDAMAAAITPETKLFILCNPHNPTGRAFTRQELETIAELCLRHDVIICSDEIHSDLTLGDQRHIPIATLAPEVARQTITLLAPSKTFNIPGLACSLVIAEDQTLMGQLRQAGQGIVPHVNSVGMHAALAAYRSCDDWLQELRDYLTRNRDLVSAFVANELPGIRATHPEATYLSWLDCREADLDENPHRFFLKRAQVALNDGRHFGPGGEGFVRLNFGCPRATLEAALRRMQVAWEARQAGEPSSAAESTASA